MAISIDGWMEIHVSLKVNVLSLIFLWAKQNVVQHAIAKLRQ